VQSRKMADTQIYQWIIFLFNCFPMYKKSYLKYVTIISRFWARDRPTRNLHSLFYHL
jgi:hypothetical protein